MSQPPDNDTSEITRVTQEIAGRLRARGIEVLDSDSPEEVVSILEALEGFERAVEAAGGDLMMDEPPSNQRGEPDDPHFLLPKRSRGESAADYMQRLTAATVAARKHKPLT
jgi:broad specificity phosphatase PhoE